MPSAAQASAPPELHDQGVLESLGSRAAAQQPYFKLSRLNFGPTHADLGRLSRFLGTSSCYYLEAPATCHICSVPGDQTTFFSDLVPFLLPSFLANHNHHHHHNHISSSSSSSPPPPPTKFLLHFIRPTTAHNKHMAVRQNNMMETYHGIVRTPADAIKLFEACRLGLLPRVQRRLSEKERQSIRSGSVFVWDEREAGMRRWTDGKSWSASRVSGSFLTYREMEGKRGGGFGTSSRRSAGKTPDSGRGSDDMSDDGEPDGYRYKADGLMKQSFSITTSQGQHLHLISYFSRPHPSEPELPQPSSDPSLRHIVPVKGMYPESSMNDQPVPATTRTPMASYTHPPPPHPGYHPQYTQQPYPGWPPSPMATPPYSHYTVSGHYPTVPLPHPHGYPHHPHYMSGPPPPPPPPPHHLYEHRPSLPPPTAAAQPRITPPILPPAHTSPYLAQVRIKEESPRSQHLHYQPPPLIPGPGRSMPGPLPTTLPRGSTPPARALSQSPTIAPVNTNTGSSSNKASLSALLHPTPSDSEPTSANPSAGSASSSPRALGVAPNTGGPATTGLAAMGFHEDARALDVLNKKFSI